MNINFYWQGQQWDYLNRLCIASHLQNNHKVTMWLNGEEPNSQYWIDDLPVEIKDANDILNIDEYKMVLENDNVPTDQIPRLVSDLWSWKLLYIIPNVTYCDTDIIALKSWNSFDKQSIFTTDDNIHSTVALLKSKTLYNPIFKYCMDNAAIGWGNMILFTEACKKYKQEWTHKREVFHPIAAPDVFHPLTRRPRFLDDTEMYDAKGLHYYNFVVSKYNIDETWWDKFPNCIFAQLHRKYFTNIKPYKD